MTDSTRTSWIPTDSAPWEHAAPPRADPPPSRYQEDLARYRAAFGHIEKRHFEENLACNALQGLTALIAGLVMALGFFPIPIFIIAIFIWRALSEVIDQNEANDRARRADYGVD